MWRGYWNIRKNRIEFQYYYYVSRCFTNCSVCIEIASAPHVGAIITCKCGCVESPDFIKTFINDSLPPSEKSPAQTLKLSGSVDCELWLALINSIALCEIRMLDH